MAFFKCSGGINPTGNATAGDVKSGKTFSNADGTDLVGTFAAQEKTVTSSRSAQTVTPDSGKYLSKVTVNALAPSGTYKPTARANNNDMGTAGNYRYVDTTAVPNTNSGTYTYAANSTGGTVDMGATNTYRYVNAANVYAKGKADGGGYLYKVIKVNWGGRITQSWTCQKPGEIVIVCVHDSNSGAITSTSTTGNATILKKGESSDTLDGAYMSIVFLKSAGATCSVVHRQNGAYTYGVMYVLQPVAFTPTNATLTKTTSNSVPAKSLQINWSKTRMTTVTLSDNTNGNILVDTKVINDEGGSYPSYLVVVGAGATAITDTISTPNYRATITVS